MRLTSRGSPRALWNSASTAGGSNSGISQPARGAGGGLGDGPDNSTPTALAVVSEIPCLGRRGRTCSGRPSLLKIPVVGPVELVGERRESVDEAVVNAPALSTVSPTRPEGARAGPKDSSTNPQDFLPLDKDAFRGRGDGPGPRDHPPTALTGPRTRAGDAVGGSAPKASPPRLA